MASHSQGAEPSLSGLRLVWAGPSLILEDQHRPRRGCFAFWLEDLERLLHPSLGAPAFDPDDEFVVLYRSPALSVERVAAVLQPLIRLSRGPDRTFLLDPAEWNALIDASQAVLCALRRREAVSWAQLRPAAERSAA